MPNNLLRYRLTLILIVLNSIVYLFSSFYSHALADMNINVLVDMGALYGPLVVLKGEWWRLLSAMFLHGGVTHLLMNMFSLYLVGRAAETYFDTKSYLVIYLFSGLIGGVVSLFVHPVTVGIGASGAIFGLFGALAGFFLAHRKKISTHFKSFMKDFAIIIGVNLLIGFSIPEVDVFAHAGGLLVGVIGGFLISKNPKFLPLYSVCMALVIVASMPYLASHYAYVLF